MKGRIFGFSTIALFSLVVAISMPSIPTYANPPNQEVQINDFRMDQTIDQAIQLTQAPYFWKAGLKTLIRLESNGDPFAYSESGAKGLCQLPDNVFKDYKLPGHDNIWNPEDNLIAAIRYIQARWNVYQIPGIVKGNYNGF